MIYLPLYVLYEYPDLEVQQCGVFYNMKNNSWYLTESVCVDEMLRTITKLGSRYQTEMGLPTTYRKTNEKIKKMLRQIFRYRVPEKLKTRDNNAELFVALIDGKKTRRMKIDVKTKSNLRILGTSYLDTVNSDCFTMTNLETPRYYHPTGNQRPTVGIYSWYVEYESENGEWFWNCVYGCHGRNIFPTKRLLVGGHRNNEACYGNVVSWDGDQNPTARLKLIVVDFEYIFAGHLRRVYVNIEINKLNQTEQRGKEMKCVRRQTFGIVGKSFYDTYLEFSGVNIPENLICDPNESKANRVVEHIIDMYFNTHLL